MILHAGQSRRTTYAHMTMKSLKARSPDLCDVTSKHVQGLEEEEGGNTFVQSRFAVIKFYSGLVYHLCDDAVSTAELR
jgi:hypothetical protein